MIIFVFLIFAVCLINIKVAPSGRLFADYADRKNTVMINGIFVLLVFLSHISTYITAGGTADAMYLSMKKYLSQMVVVSFLFYSGYGIMESIKRKGKTYVLSIPKNRFLKTLVHLWFAVLLFIAMNAILNKKYPTKSVLLSFFGIGSVGNSNWYMFVILLLYLIVFVSFVVFTLTIKNEKIANALGLIVTTALSVAAIILIKKYGNGVFDGFGRHWYNTILVYPLGMIFSLLKKPIDRILSVDRENSRIKNNAVYMIIFGIVFLLYTYFAKFHDRKTAYYLIWGCLFALLIVLITMKIQISNPILEFFGSHVFSIYILQRIPMIVLKELGLAGTNKYVYICVCFCLTVMLACLFDWCMKYVDKVFLPKGTVKRSKCL